MTRFTTAPNGQPTLNDLMVRLLATRSDAATAAVEPAGDEVEPHDVATGFRVDPRTAWADATAPVGGGPTTPPPDWHAVVAQPTAAYAVPMAAGNFPQRVKDLHPLLTKFVPADLRPSGREATPPGLSGLRAWVGREGKSGLPSAALLAAGVARSLGDFDAAAGLLAGAGPQCSGDLRAAWENEQAALFWQRGDGDAALAAWERAAPTPASLFNRGMALLFLGKSAEARGPLTAAVAALPGSGGWAELARLYLAVAEIHG